MPASSCPKFAHCTVFDGALPKGAFRITKLLVHAGTQVNAMTVSYSDVLGGNIQTLGYGSVGTNAGAWNELALAASEQITEVSGRSDNIVRQLACKTNQGKTFGPFGIAQGAAFSVTGKTIIGFFGRWGTSLDQLGFMRLNSLPTLRTAALGGAGGTVFDATPPPGAAKISRLSVHAGGQLNQIRLDWWDAGGGLVGSASFGG